ncbi:protein Shroom2-like [Elysia marginata]|uniref:Protein Shroom2-like n=1 Tax=Elysia marginata TaxID=1093978 RepID=A0AAV4J920_9GAST|nr:protein Shroom2-like [Elysia marginata]
MGRRWTLTGAAHGSGHPVVMYACQRWGLKFAEDSYIGHKNKSSRPIGTYQRSKSAAVLPTSGASSNNNNSGGSSSSNSVSAGQLHTRSVSTADNSGLRVGGTVGAAGGEDSLSPFPSSRLAHQQAWTSEIVLSSAAHAQATGAIDSNLGRCEVSPPSSQSYPSGGVPQQQTPPSRPARPNAQHSRSDSGGAGGVGDSTATTASPAEPALSSVSPSSSSPSSYRRDASNVPRRQPPPVPDTSLHEGQRSTLGGAAANSDDAVLPDRSHFWPSANSSSPKGEGVSPQRRQYTGSIKDRQWASQDTGSYQSPATSPASSSQANNTSSGDAPSSPPRSPGEVVAPPLALPPRDYKRRESAPARPAPSGSNLSTLENPALGNSRLQPPHDPSDRRQSDSSNNLDSQTLSLHPASLSPNHSRQPSQEELECDHQALVLAKHLAGKGADQKLFEVLRLDTDKKRMQFMDGLFSQSQTSINTMSFDGHLPSSEKGSVLSVPSAVASTTGSGGAALSVSTPPTTPPSNGSAATTRVPAQNGSSESGLSTDLNQRSSLPKEYWMSPSKAVLEMEWRKNEGLGKDLTKDINDSGSLVKQKEALLEKLHKKLEILKGGKLSLQQEIADNDLLGAQVRTQVEARCQSRAEKDKFTSFLDDLEKIVRLLLNLSGQLARAENAVQALPPDVDSKLRKLTLDKRERLYAKHEEAKLLKDDLDKRGEQVTTMLKERLLPAQLADYVHFVQTRSQLTIELQEMEDKITLGGEQIQALRKSIPEATQSDLQVGHTSRSDLSDPAPS